MEISHPLVKAELNLLINSVKQCVSTSAVNVRQAINNTELQPPTQTALPRIIIADDDPDVAQDLGAYLSGEGFEVVLLTIQALASDVENYNPLAIICDFRFSPKENWQGLNIFRK